MVAKLIDEQDQKLRVDMGRLVQSMALAPSLHRWFIEGGVLAA